MLPLFAPAAPVSALAVLTTVHIALVLVRHHRQPPGNGLSVPTFVAGVLASTPWWLSSVPGLASGLAVHLAWFVACERFPRTTAPARVPTTATTAARPSSAPPPAAARPPARAVRTEARAKGWVQAPVIAVVDESPDIRTFRVARPEGFDFRAGQFVAIRIRVSGGEQVRCYSISSAPEASGYLEISVKRQGVVSSTLHATVRPGSMLSMRAPGGNFAYPDGEDRPLLLLAGGVGITPLVSMVRHGVAADPGRPMVLLYSARTEQDLAFQDELRLLARRHPSFRVAFAATRSAERADVYRGRIDAALIRSAMPEVSHAVALMCGPEAMVAELREMLTNLGVAQEQQRYELFEAAVAAASKMSSTDVASSAATTTGSVEIHACKSNRRATANAGQSLLDAAEAHGIDIPSLCRSGVCGTCRTKVVSGDVHCSASMLDDDDRADGIVLACVASAASDCVIEA